MGIDKNDKRLKQRDLGGVLLVSLEVAGLDTGQNPQNNPV